MAYIKQMICTGFKSFRKRTIINFDKGFTAIVGANGSGKSNIIDAFVFVLGELSAKTLRANNIKDLISNGGNGLAAAETATVELIFDNTDRSIPLESDEVNILRKIDTEGNGIYRINDKKASRKEIMNLLELAGLMPNSSNMIMQGELFRLINMNPIERRQLIEDIAGIASYNEKRISAEDELKQVESNLNQISVLLNEVHLQLQQLEKEKNDAVKFLDLVKKEKTHKNALQFVRIRDAENRILTYLVEKKECESQVVRIHDLDASLKQKIEGLQLQITELNDKIKNLQDSELLKLTQEVGHLREHISELRAGLKFSQKAIERVEAAQQDLEQRLVGATTQRTALSAEIGELKSKKAQLLDEIQQKSAAMESFENQIRVIDSQFASIKDQIQRLNSEIGGKKDFRGQKVTALRVLENEIGSLTKQRQKNEEKIYHLQQEIERNKIEMQELRTQKAQLLSDAGVEDLSKDQIELQIKAHETKIGQLQAEQKVQQQLSRQKHAELVELQSKQKVMKQITAGNRAVEAIQKLKASGKLSGIFGTIADLGSADPKYALAMEMAAGGKFSWIVVDHQYTAEACINYLKENKMGRATFIPLSAVKVTPFDDPLPRDPKIIGKAIDLIEFDPLVKKAFEFVFNRVVIVQDLHTAVELRIPAKKVTLEGDVVESSNIMSGGQQAKPTGIGFKSSDDQLIATLELESNRHQSQVDSIENEIKQLQRAISDLYRRKISGDKETQQISQKLAVCKAQLDRLTPELRNCEGEIEDIFKQIQIKEQEKDGLKTTIAQIDSEIQMLDHQATELQGQINSSIESDLKMQFRDAEREVKKLTKASTELDLKLAKMETMLNETIGQNIATYTLQIAQYKEEYLKLNRTLNDNTLDLQKDELRLQTLEEKVREKSQVVSDLITSKKKLTTEQANYKMDLGRLSDEIHPIQMKLNTLQLKIGELESKILEYKTLTVPEIEVPDALLQMAEQEHLTTLDHINTEKLALGAVNLKAIEKFAEIEVRYKDLGNKHETIIQERLAILDFIQNLEAEKKKVFMTTFTNINKNFAYIFSRLSPKGEAKLELDNLEDPFTGGVQIMARPGEKKWCLTQAMSGGEKTLTIIALILGIQMHVPSPYYVLDEIDAALDDANAAQVADLIKDLSARSQFIIITHRDVTMARTDHLLGVSNREGVSSVVNLSIKSVLEQIAKEKAENPQPTEVSS